MFYNSDSFQFIFTFGISTIKDTHFHKFFHRNHTLVYNSKGMRTVYVFALVSKFILR